LNPGRTCGWLGTSSIYAVTLILRRKRSELTNKRYNSGCKRS
jgi:hypothetical protein